MTVYVDNMYRVSMGQFGRLKMSHMMADKPDELLVMADAIGCKRKWIQQAGTPDEHFDIPMSKRAKAITYGAVEVTMREMARIRAKWRREALKANCESKKV